MKILLLLKFLILLLVFASCSSKLEPSEIYEKYEKSVVLIRHDYFYYLELKDGSQFYFILNENNEIDYATFDKNEIIKYPMSLTGTGFFVSKDGLLATNMHVTIPSFDESFDVFKSIQDYLKDNPDIAINKINELLDNYTYYTNELTKLNLTEDKIKEYKEYSIKCEQDYYFWDELKKDNFLVNEEDSEFYFETVHIGIAYNNSFAIDSDDYKECIILDSEDNTENPIDLALIQLKDKTTPLAIKDVFLLDGSDKNKLKINDKIYMIGFNYGTDIGNTTEGLKNQITQGTVSQEPDKNRVLYSIPTLGGSSGSPVVNEFGELVAINYSGYEETQGFNYGIPSKHLKELINTLKK